MRSALILSFSLIPGLAGASALDQLRVFSSGLETVTAYFEQQVFDPDGRPLDTVSGELALAAPNLLRWDYLEPYEQMVLADGLNVWVYDPDLEQASVRPQEEAEANSPLAVLVDLSQLTRMFDTRELGHRDGLDWLELRPRDREGGFQEARLGFRGDRLQRMESVDGLGQTSVLEFSDWRRNAYLDGDFFSFRPAPGTDVIGETRRGAVARPLR